MRLRMLGVRAGDAPASHSCLHCSFGSPTLADQTISPVNSRPHPLSAFSFRLLRHSAAEEAAKLLAYLQETHLLLLLRVRVVAGLSLRCLRCCSLRIHRPRCRVPSLRPGLDAQLFKHKQSGKVDRLFGTNMDPGTQTMQENMNKKDTMV